MRHFINIKLAGWMTLLLLPGIMVAQEAPPPVVSEAVAQAVQQKQQLIQQFGQDVKAATPDERLALISTFRQQLSSAQAALDAQVANLTVLGPTNQSQMPEAISPTALSGNTQWQSAIQQRQQLVLQLDGAAPEGKITLLVQLRAQMTQVEQLSQLALPAINSPVVSQLDAQAMHAQALAVVMATLPQEQQVEIQAIAQLLQ